LLISQGKKDGKISLLTVISRENNFLWLVISRGKGEKTCLGLVISHGKIEGETSLWFLIPQGKEDCLIGVFQSKNETNYTNGKKYWQCKYVIHSMSLIVKGTVSQDFWRNCLPLYGTTPQWLKGVDRQLWMSLGRLPGLPGVKNLHTLRSNWFINSNFLQLLLKWP